MSCSFYRGKVRTDAEIKGPFTEAHDEITTGFQFLKEQADYEGKADVVVHERSDGRTDILFLVGEVWLCVSDDGLVEIGEGAA